MKKLIRNGTIVTAEETYAGSILVEDEKIIKIYRKDSPENESCKASGYEPDVKDRASEVHDDTEVIDAGGKLIFPGFIDAHTHFDLHVAGTVTADDFPSGTAAAIAGGTTVIIDFGTQYKGETLEEGLDNWQKKALKGASCDYGIHMSITDWNEDARRDCQRMIDEGVTSFKLYMTYDTKVDDRTLYEVLCRLKEVGGITGVHCENSGLIEGLQNELAQGDTLTKVSSHYRSRPAAAEAEAVGRLLHIAEVVDIPVMDVHLTCEEALEEIRAARKRGQMVYAETCPQYLTMTKDLYDLPGFDGAAYVCSPPLRSRSDVEVLWKALADGEIQTISTDHCSFTLEQKKLGTQDFRKIPGGMPGVGTRVPVIYSEGVKKGRITLQDMVKLMALNPAKIYGLYPRKGHIAEGADADIVIFNPEKKWVITAAGGYSRAGYEPLEGKEITGMVEDVFLRGTKVVEDGKVICRDRGIYLKRQKSECFK